MKLDCVDFYRWSIGDLKITPDFDFELEELLYPQEEL